MQLICMFYVYIAVSKSHVLFLLMANYFDSYLLHVWNITLFFLSHCKAAICFLWSYITHTHVINYEDKWLLQHGSRASSCDREWDILDTTASRIMILQLALSLQAN